MSNKFTNMIKTILPDIKQKNIDYMSLNRLRLNLSADSTLPFINTYTQNTRNISEMLQKKLEEGGISFETPEILLNPFGVTPLSALVLFHTETPCGVAYTVKGHKTSDDWHFVYPALSTAHAVPVFGLYPDMDNLVDLSLIDENNTTIHGSRLHIRTSSLSAADCLSVTDNSGDIRYVLSLPANSCADDVIPYGDHHFLVRDCHICTPAETAPLPTHLYETDVLGRVYRTCYVGCGITSLLKDALIKTDAALAKEAGLGRFLRASDIMALDFTTGAAIPAKAENTGQTASFQEPFRFGCSLNTGHIETFQSLTANGRMAEELTDVEFATTGWLREPVPYKGASIETSSAVDYQVLQEKYHMNFSICGDTLLIQTTGNQLQEVVFSKSDRIYQLDLTTPMIPSEETRYTLAVPFTQMYSGTYSIVVRFRNGGQEALANTITLSRTRK